MRFISCERHKELQTLKAENNDRFRYAIER